MTTKSHNTKTPIKTNIIHAPEKQSSHQDLTARLITKELEILALAINLDREELQVWLDLEMNQPISAPAKSILHLLRTANQYCLNPLQDEVVLTQFEQIWQVFIGIDGWITLMNRHPAFAGVTFLESTDHKDEIPVWMECTIYRSDRMIPTTVREHYCEVRNESAIWVKMPRRMMRHRALQQCVRLAMGIAPPENQGEIPRTKTKPSTEKKYSTPEQSAEPVFGIELLKVKLDSFAEDLGTP
jgi:hypothetical protein